MLQDIRKKSQGTVAKIIVGTIVVTFALFGVDSIVGGMNGEPEVAKVNGEGIPESTFKRALEGKRRQILAQMGENVDPDLIDEEMLRTSVLEGLIQEQILTEDAEDKGLYVSDQAIDSYIRSIEQFKQDGVFSNERMQMTLRNVGLTLKDYKDSLKMQFLLSQPRSALIASAFVLDQERNEIVELDRQARTFGLVTVFKGDYLDSIAISDDDVAGYYESNKEQYKKPRNVDVSFIEVDKLDLAANMQVSQEEVTALYEIEKAEYKGEEKRRASHILIKIGDSRSEQEALSLINDVQTRVNKGEPFDQIATQLSEDEGSVAEGGDLGLSGRGVYVSDFENALFSLAVGEVSKPVKTEFGYHLIKLTSIENNDIPTLEGMRESLESRVRSKKADQAYAELLEKLADLSYASANLDDPAKELKLEVRELSGVSAETQDPLFSNLKVQKVLFSSELLEEHNNSEVIEVGDGQAIVFRVNSFHEESILPLSEVNEQIRNLLKDKKAAEYAESVGQAFIARVSAGENPEEVSMDMGLGWKVHTSLKRDNVMVNPEVLSTVFTLKLDDQGKSEPIGFKVLDGDYAIVVLTEINKGDLAVLTPSEISAISNMLSGGFGAGDYKNYEDTLVKVAEVERI